MTMLLIAETVEVINL